jgi:hypothetical protein
MIRLIVLALPLTVAMILAACGGDDDDDSSATTAPPSASTPAAVTTGASEQTTVASAEFISPVTMEIGAGWAVVVDIADIFVLEHTQDDTGPLGDVGMAYPIAVYSHDGLQQEDVPSDLVAWVEAHPRLIINDKQDVEVGGLTGVKFELASDQGSDWAFMEHSDGTFDVRYNDHFFFYILETTAGQLTLFEGAEQPSRLHEFLPISGPIIASMEFEGG